MHLQGTGCQLVLECLLQQLEIGISLQIYNFKHSSNYPIMNEGWRVAFLSHQIWNTGSGIPDLEGFKEAARKGRGTHEWERWRRCSCFLMKCLVYEINSNLTVNQMVEMFLPLPTQAKATWTALLTVPLSVLKVMFDTCDFQSQGRKQYDSYSR